MPSRMTFTKTCFSSLFQQIFGDFVIYFEYVYISLLLRMIDGFPDQQLNHQTKQASPHEEAVTGLSQFMPLIDLTRQKPAVSCCYLNLRYTCRTDTRLMLLQLEVARYETSQFIDSTFYVHAYTVVRWIGPIFSPSLSIHILVLWRRYSPVKLAHRQIYYCIRPIGLIAAYSILSFWVELISILHL